MISEFTWDINVENKNRMNSVRIDHHMITGVHINGITTGIQDVPDTSVDQAVPETTEVQEIPEIMTVKIQL